MRVYMLIWARLQLRSKVPPLVWIKIVRRLDVVEIFYLLDDNKTYVMTRNAPLQDNNPVMVGLMAACPDGNGFEAKFESFSLTPS